VKPSAKKSTSVSKSPARAVKESVPFGRPNKQVEESKVAQVRRKNEIEFNLFLGKVSAQKEEKPQKVQASKAPLEAKKDLGPAPKQPNNAYMFFNM